MRKIWTLEFPVTFRVRVWQIPELCSPVSDSDVRRRQLCIFVAARLPDGYDKKTELCCTNFSESELHYNYFIYMLNFFNAFFSAF